MTGADNGFNDRRDEDMRGVVSLAVSPDGQCCATAVDHCDIELWDAETRAHITRLEYNGEVFLLEFLSDSQLVPGSWGGEI